MGGKGAGIWLWIWAADGGFAVALVHSAQEGVRGYLQGRDLPDIRAGQAAVFDKLLRGDAGGSILRIRAPLRDHRGQAGLLAWR